MWSCDSGFTHRGAQLTVNRLLRRRFFRLCVGVELGVGKSLLSGGLSWNNTNPALLPRQPCTTTPFSQSATSMYNTALCSANQQTFYISALSHQPICIAHSNQPIAAVLWNQMVLASQSAESIQQAYICLNLTMHRLNYCLLCLYTVQFNNMLFISNTVAERKVVGQSLRAWKRDSTYCTG